MLSNVALVEVVVFLLVGGCHLCFRIGFVSIHLSARVA